MKKLNITILIAILTLGITQISFASDEPKHVLLEFFDSNGQPLVLNRSSTPIVTYEAYEGQHGGYIMYTEGDSNKVNYTVSPDSSPFSMENIKVGEAFECTTEDGFIYNLDPNPIFTVTEELLNNSQPVIINVKPNHDGYIIPGCDFKVKLTNY